MAAGSTSTISTWRIALLVFVPFMSAYLLSELLRNVNGVLSRILETDLGLGPEQLGLLTSVFLAAIAGSQVFVGIALDRYGPRRVVGCLMIVASAGCLLFASDSFLEMVAGRFLIGLGMAACWTAAFKANAMWAPPDRLAFVNSATLGLAGLGALAATLPAELIFERMHWHTVFMILSGATLVLAAVVWFVVPDHETETGESRPSLAEEFRGMGRVAMSAVFWKLGPISFLCQGIWLAYQGLWAGVWMRQVDRLEPISAASNLFALALAVVIGQFVFGFIADQLTRRGVSLWTTMAVTTSLFVGVQMIVLFNPDGMARPLWIAYGLFTAGPIFTYALISLALPRHLSGRAISLLNLFSTLSGFLLQYGVGAIIELWAPDADGIYPVIAHQTALGIVVAMQIAALLWMFIPLRPQEIGQRATQVGD